MIMTGMNKIVYLKRWVPTIAIASLAILCSTGIALADTSTPSEVKYQEISAAEGKTDILKSGEVYVNLPEYTSGLENDIPEYIHSTEYDVEYKKDANGNLIPKKNQDGTPMLDAAGNPIYEIKGEKKEKSQQYWKTENGELITPTEEQIKREKESSTEKNTEIYCDPEDGTYYEDVTVLSKNAIQKAIDKALAEASKQTADGKWVDEMVVRVMAGTYDGDINVSVPTATRSDWSGFTLKVLADDSFEMNGTELEISEIGWARPDLEDKKYELLLEDDFHMIHLDPDKEGIIKKDDNGNEIITADSAGNAKVNGSININGINVVLAGLYYSLESTIKAKNAIVDIYGTKKDDNITAVGVEGGKGTQISIHSGAGDDTVTVRGDVQLYSVRASGSESTKDEFMQIRVEPATISASSNVAVYAGAGDDIVNIDTSTAYFTATVSIDGGPANGSDRIHLTGQTTTESKANAETREIKLIYADGSTNIISEASMSEAKKHASYSQLIGKDKDGFFLNEEVFHKIFGASLSELPGTEEAEIKEIVIKTATASDSEGKDVYTVDTYTDDLEGKDYVYIDLSTPSDMPEIWNYINEANKKEGIYFTGTGELGSTWQNLVDYNIDVSSLYDESSKKVILKDIWFDGRDGNSPMGGFLSKVIIDSKHKPLNVTGRIGYKDAASADTLGIEGLNILIKSEKLTLCNGSSVIGNNVNLFAKTADTNLSDWLDEKIGFSLSDDLSIMDFVSDVSLKAEKGSTVYSRGETTVTSETDLTHGLIPYAAANTVAVKLGSSTLTLEGNITSAATVDIKSLVKIAIDVSNLLLSKWYIPVAVNVAISDAELTMKGNITANGRIKAGAQSDVLVTTKAVTGKLPVAIAVSVIDSDAHVKVDGATINSGKGRIELYANAETKAETAAQNKFNIRKPDKSTSSNSKQIASGSQTGDPKVSKYETVKTYGVWSAVAVVNQDTSVIIDKAVITSDSERGLTVRSESKQDIVTKSTSADPSIEEEKNKPQIASRSEEGKRQKSEVDKETESVFDKIYNFFSDKGSEENTSNANGPSDSVWDKIKNVISGAKASSSDANKKTDDANSQPDTPAAQFVGATTVLVDNNTSELITENSQFNVKKADFVSNAVTKLKTAADASQVKRPDGQKPDESYKPTFSGGIGVAVDVANITNNALIRSGTFTDTKLSALTDTVFDSVLSAAAGYNKGNYGISGVVAVAVNDVITQSAIMKPVVLKGKSSMVSKASSKVNVKTEAAGTMPKDYKDYQKVGVGAAVAVDVTNIETTAYVDKVSVNENTDGKKEIKDITVSAKNTGKEELNAYAGSQGGVSFTPVVGVMVTGAYVEAVLGNPDEAKYVADGYVYDAGGSILIDSLNNMDRSLTVDAFAAGQSAAIGGTVAVSVINDTADSILKAYSKSNTLKVNSKNVSNIKEKSTASAKGASPSTASDSESGSGTSNSGKSDGNGDSGSSDPSPDGQANGALDKIGKIVNGKSGKGAGKNQADNAKNRQKAETAEGKVAVAAAFVLSIQNLICKSEVIDGVSIVTFADPSVTEEEKAGDTIEVSAETIRKSDIFANGSTVKSEVGVGVAVAINLTDSDPLKDGTKAQIGNGIVNTGTLNMTANSDNTIITESVSGAGAKNVGIAGSVAITVAKTYSDAVVKSSSNKNSDRIIRLNVEESLKQNVETTASSRIDPLSGRADKNDDAVKDANKDVKGPNEPAVVVLENHDPQGTKTEKNLASTTNGKYNLPDKVDVPSWSGCKFNGYFNAESGGTKVYDENGKLIKTDIHPEDEGITLHAQWTDNRTDEQKNRDEKIKKDIQKKEQEEEERKQQEAAEGDSKVGVGAAFALTDAIASGTAKVTGRNIGAEDDESFAEKKIYISSYTISKGKAVAVAGHEDNSPKYALDAAVAIVILDTGAIAEISDAVIIGDILEISATSEDTTYTQASGKVKGGTAAVGASVAVNIPTTTTEAIFSGNATLTESAEITSKEDSTDTAYTVTSAKGASASKNVKKYDPNATDEDIENTKDDLNNDKTGKIDSYAGRTDVNPGNNTAGRINGAINGGKASNGNKTSNSLPVSTNVMRANNVKTEGTSEDTDLGKDIKKNVDDGNKESGAENNVPQTESTHIQFAAAVSVLDTSHKVHTYINKDNAYGTIIVTKGYINIASTCEEIFQSLATGAAMGKDNNNDIAAAVAVAVENNEALTTVGGKLEAQPDEEILENLEKAGDNTGVHITSFNKCNVGAALDLGAQALAGSFSGDESKVTISGAVAIIKSNNKSIVTVNKESNITGLNVVIFADDLSKMGVRAGGLSKAGEKSSVGLGASFALVYDNTRIQTIVEDNVKINAYGVLISSEKSGVTFTLNTLINHLMSAVVSINQPEGKQGLINIGLDPFEIKQNAYTDEQKKGDWTEAIPRYIRAFGNFQTQTNYYVEALAGNISGKDGGAAVAGSVGMLFYEVLTETNIGNNLQIGHPEYEINKGTVAKQKASASEAADKRYAEGSTLKEETEAAEKEFTVQEAKWNKIKEERKNTTAEGQAVYASYSEAKSEYHLQSLTNFPEVQDQQ